MRSVAFVVLTLVAVAAPARAQDPFCGASAPYCLSQRVRLFERRELVVPAAIAFTTAATLAAIYDYGRHQSERQLPPGVIATTDSAGRPRLVLPLIPTVAPVQSHTPEGDLTVRPSWSLRLDDAITNATLAVAGTALAASIIAGFLKK